MFTSVATAANSSSPTSANPFSGLRLSDHTVVAGSLIGSAIVGRVMAWFGGGATIAQLVGLLVIATAALLTGYLANTTAEKGTLDARLAKLTMRAGCVQTVLGVVTLAAAIQ